MSFALVSRLVKEILKLYVDNGITDVGSNRGLFLTYGPTRDRPLTVQAVESSEDIRAALGPHSGQQYVIGRLTSPNNSLKPFDPRHFACRIVFPGQHQGQSMNLELIDFQTGVVRQLDISPSLRNSLTVLTAEVENSWERTISVYDGFEVIVGDTAFEVYSLELDIYGQDSWPANLPRNQHSNHASLVFYLLAKPIYRSRG